MRTMQPNPLVILVILTLVSFPLDHLAVRAIASLPPEIVAEAKGIAVYGQAIWYLVPAFFLAGTLFAFSRTRPWLRQAAEMTAFVFIAVAIAGIGVDILKHIIGRPRPNFLLSHPDATLNFFSFSAKYASFPSGHTAAVVAFAMAVSAVFAPHSPGVRWPLYIWAGIMALCRLIGLDHYPSDVFAGAAIAAFTTRRLIRWGIRREILIPARPRHSPARDRA